MDTYEKLLDNAYASIKAVTGKSERFEIPKAIGQIEGNTTIITNLPAIASYIRRPVENLAKFLIKELAIPGANEKERLILKGKLNSLRVNEKISIYVTDVVLCPECKKPDTEVIADKGIKFKHCLACGAKTPIRTRI
jgi:translation initiation factor 2 subunit 2